MVRLAVVAHHPPGRSGERPAFVLVHGLASNARLWDGVGDALAAVGYSSIAVDLRGHGQSPKVPASDGYGFDVVTADLLETFDEFGLDGEFIPTVVGQSWGGNVVVDLAANHPDRIRAMAAVDGGTIRLADRFPDWNECATRLAPPELVGTPLTQMRSWMTSAHPDWSAQAIDGTLANFEVRGDGTVIPWLSRDRHMAILRALWGHDPVACFARFSKPSALLVAGSRADWAHDKASGVKVCVDASPVPVSVEWFDGADHDLHAQHPVRTAEALIGLHDAAVTLRR
jgi:pimeloyl-ACP methyl ester carboxylesterase